MRVLVGCEESGKVRDAFIARGHDAHSNDLVPARYGGPHIQKCVKRAIVEDGPWDIIILHPDCTRMALSGNRWYGKDKPKHKERMEAVWWTVDLYKLAVQHARIGVALENPKSVIFKYLVGVNGTVQYIHPWQFGHKEIKPTGLKLSGLPTLKPTNVVGPPPKKDSPERKSWERIWRMARSETRKRDRSETFDGISDAMATQWGILDNPTPTER